MKIMISLAAAVALVSAPAFAGSGDAFECNGATTGNFYDLEIIDVGDEEGEVVVNNGGAPQTVEAHYDSTANGGHSFIFGFDLFNEDVVPMLSSIEISERGSKWTGKVEYFEHDSDSQSHQLIEEKISCKKVR